ncbi:MAG: pyridoxamine 5'-phosphate oxidase family protein, partial [Epulopiscium sp.]|nr:pyridoxamine 5'-phosphate oxidase family protein [Candidatus Epulonipiscium sp.]
KDREMNKEFAYSVIDKANHGTLSVMDKNGEPYGVPLSIIRKDNALYFHAAKEGKKNNIFKDRPIVSISFVGETKVPDNYSNEELDEISKDKSKMSLLVSKVFTTEYESAIVKGRIELVESHDEKIKALTLICSKYTPDKMQYVGTAIKSGIERVSVYKIEIDDISAKRKKYDSQGKEMKWGRI